MPNWRSTPQSVRSIIKKGIHVYREEGTISVAKRGYRLLHNGWAYKKFARLPLVWNTHLYLSRKKLWRTLKPCSTPREVFDAGSEFEGYGYYRSVQPMQHPEEILPVLDIVKRDSPETVVEIGSAAGGTLLLWSRCLSADHIISVDVNNDRKRTPFFESFSRDTQITCVRGYGESEETVGAVQNSLAGDTVDFLFQDGGHEYETVREQFERYRPLMSEDGVVAFHDISERDDRPEWGVNRFWEEINDQYETEEFHHEESSAGIGLLYL